MASFLNIMNQSIVIVNLKVEAAMKKNRWKARGSLYPLIWTVILLASGYILIKFAVLSGSDKDGQAQEGVVSTLVSSICINMMETGSSLISYIMTGEAEVYTFPVSKIVDRLPLEGYSKSSQAALTNNIDTSISTNMELNNQSNSKLHFMDLTDGYLDKEYVLSNGAIFVNINNEDNSDYMNGYSNANHLDIGIEKGNVVLHESEDKSSLYEYNEALETMQTSRGIEFTLDQLRDVSFLIRNFYIIDEDAAIKESLFNSETLLNKDMTLKQKNEKPQILIYHTHSQETFLDSREGVWEDTVVGIGSLLKEELENKYGYNVIHNKSVYDLADGTNIAYNHASKGLQEILDKYPSIEVIIDLHRDGMPARTIVLDGKETAQVMLFNGLSRDTYGPITRLDNPNLENNLAFSLKLQLKSLELYPNFFFRNYLHAYRYNLHFRGKSILVEWGTYLNTLQQAKNSIEPFAEVLNAVLQGK